MKSEKKLLFVVTEDWYFCSHRLPLARAAQREGFDVAVVTREDREGERIRSEGVRLIPLDMKRGKIGSLTDISTVVALWRIFRSERPALIHNVAMKPVILGTLAARLAGVKVVVNALAGLGYVFTSREPRALVLKVLVRAAFRVLFHSRAIYVIVQNSVDRRIVSDLGVGAYRTALIAGSGVDIGVFVPTPEPDGPVTVAMVSRMLWDKGVKDLVEAACILRKEDRNVVVRLVGPMDPANPSSIPESTLKGWVRDGIVEWLGPTSDVAAVWAKAHIGVLPSYREGLPKSLLEAAACGRPLITTNVPGCRDVVIHEENGLLVPLKNPKALAEAVVRLADNPDIRARMGRAARKRVESHFSVETIVRQTVGLYRMLVTAAQST